jgi:hypothetical protein
VNLETRYIKRCSISRGNADVMPLTIFKNLITAIKYWSFRATGTGPSSKVRPASGLYTKLANIICHR